MNQVIIFDFDDTLIDNRTLDYQGFIQPSKKLGLSIPKKNQIINLRKKGFLARKIIKLVSMNSPKKFSIKDYLSLRQKFLNKEESIRYLHLKKDTLSVLKTLKTKKIAIYLSSVRSNKKLVKVFLKQKKIDKYFTKIYFQEDLGFELNSYSPVNRILVKTSLLRLIQREVKSNSNNIIYVGNSVEDLRAAQRLLIPFIYFWNAYTKKEKTGKIVIVKNMNELKKKIYQGLNLK